MSKSDVGFRRIREEDLETLRAWRNSPEIAQSMYSNHHISKDEHREWFAKIRSDASVSYWIIELEGTPVGLANVVDIDFKKRTATWAFYLADKATRGKGIGLFVEYCVLACAFNHWQLETLQCEVLETNPGVSAMHESVGFVRTGTLTGRVTRNSNPVDAHAYAMAKDNWVSAHRLRLEERIRARGREPLPLLSFLEDKEADGQLSAAFFDKIDSEIAQMRAKNLIR